MSDSSLPTTSADVVRFSSTDAEKQAPKLSRATKDVLFGSLAGMAAKYFEHPFDLVKVRLQSQPHDRPHIYNGALDCFKQTISREGVLGLYRGISMPVLGAILENASLFVTYNSVRSLIASATGKASIEDLSMPELGVSAAAAGAVASLFLTPVELVKCRMQVQAMSRELAAASAASAPAAAPAAAAAATAPSQTRAFSTSARSFAHAHASSVASSTSPSVSAASASAARPVPVKYPGPLPIVLSILRQHGPMGLWLGQTGTLLRETGGGIAWFLTFEQCSRLFVTAENARRAALTGGAQANGGEITKKELGALPLVVSGAAAGVAYNVVLFPADCVKSTMQTEYELRGGDANPNNKPTGFMQTARNIYKSRGIRGLYAGCGLTCLRSAPSSALIFLLYNKLEQLADSHGL
ncbi:mitochondrial ornithine carrier protein [Tilletia horrida]|nr:mitochondrial ornithine carrier protein [Tilletia horrida]